MANLYETLNIDSNASQDAIEQSYLELKKNYRGNDSDTAAYDLAYSILIDSEKRRAYDIGLTKDMTPPINIASPRPLPAQDEYDEKYREPWELEDSNKTHMTWSDLRKSASNAWNSRPPIRYFLKDIAWWAWPILFTLAFIWLTQFNANPGTFFVVAGFFWCIRKMILWKNQMQPPKKPEA